jgi:Zn-dependent peptidase ImmA (M78 family)
LLDTIYACEQRQEWYRTYALQEQFDPVPFIGMFTTATEIATAAAAIAETLDFAVEDRSRYSSWTAALSGLTERAEASGVLVMINGVVGANTHRKLDPYEFRGFCLVDDLAPVVFINGADTKAAQIFTLAHEIAHLWIGASGVSNATLAETAGDATEQWCNRVAAELLVPAAALSNVALDREHLTAVLDTLAKHFRVSTLVVLRRLKDTGRLTGAQFRSAYEGELERVLALKGEAGSGGNFYNTQPVRVSKHFAAALISSTIEGVTLHRDAFRLLGVKSVATFNELGHRLGVL